VSAQKNSVFKCVGAAPGEHNSGVAFSTRPPKRTNWLRRLSYAAAAEIRKEGFAAVISFLQPADVRSQVSL
jgi:hypothetical protein